MVLRLVLTLAIATATTSAASEPLQRCTVPADVEAMDKPDGKKVIFKIAAHTGVVMLKQGAGKQKRWCEVWGGRLGSGWVLCEQTRADNPDVSFVADGEVEAYDRPAGARTDLVFEKGQGGFLVETTGGWCRLSAAAAGEGWVSCARGHIEGITAVPAPTPETPRDAKVARAAGKRR